MHPQMRIWGVLFFSIYLFGPSTNFSIVSLLYLLCETIETIDERNMKMKKILTYGLNEEHSELLSQELSECEVIDVTSAFTDLLAIPAAAVVINLSVMSVDEINTFTEVFHDDLDTCICCVGKSEIVSAEDLAFMHVQEEKDDFAESIAAIREYLGLPAALEAAKLRRDNLFERINRILSPNTDTSLRAQIAHVENICSTYERICMILEKRESLKLREKVPYRVNLNSTLCAFMIAHELLEEELLEDSTLPIGLKKDWIIAMAEDIRNHYELDVILNGGM